MAGDERGASRGRTPCLKLAPDREERALARRPLLALDLMDTVVSDPFFRVVLPGMSEEQRRVFVHHKHPTAWETFERGRIDEATFLARFYRQGTPPGLPSPAQIRETVVAGYRFVDGMEALLARLREAGVRVWALSNYPVWSGALVRALGLDRLLGGMVFSHATGARKPEPEAYLALCRAARVPPGQVLVVDDRQDNVDGAREAGMDGLLFDGAGALAHELAERGILPGPGGAAAGGSGDEGLPA